MEPTTSEFLTTGDVARLLQNAGATGITTRRLLDAVTAHRLPRPATAGRRLIWAPEHVAAAARWAGVEVQS